MMHEKSNGWKKRLIFFQYTLSERIKSSTNSTVSYPGALFFCIKERRQSYICYQFALTKY